MTEKYQEQSKSALRSNQSKLRDALTKQFIEKTSIDLIKRFLLSDTYNDNDIVFTYVSYKSEVNTYPLILKCLSDGKKVFCPRIEDNEMNFYEIHSVNQLKLGMYDIMEPVTDIYGVPKKSNKTVVITPGLAFDMKGYRIGYGKGFYDRFYQRYIEADILKVGFCYENQLVSTVFPDSFDIPMNQIFTEQRSINCKGDTDK